MLIDASQRPIHILWMTSRLGCDAESGLIDPFLLVVEGSIGNEQINGDGHWSGLGVNPETGQPITTNEWIDRLAPVAAAVVAVGTCAAYGGIPAMRNNPTGAMGLPDYLGHNWRSRSGMPIELDEQLRPVWQRFEQEPDWRRPGPELTSGYAKRW